MTSPPPFARTIVLTDDGAMLYTPELAAFDGTTVALTLATALISMHVPTATVAGAVAALAPIHTAIAGYGQRLTALGV